MKREIRILILEDVAADVVAINHELRQCGLNFLSKRVDTKKAFLYELEHNAPDVILSDHGLPSFDGFTALAIARDKCPDVPFIFVTGSLGEEMTIATFESGAADYVLKNRMSRLVPAMQRALREAEERSRRKEAEQSLRESEERFRMLVEGVKDYAIFMLDTGGRVTSWNAGAEWIKGYRAEEILGQHFRCFYTREDIDRGQPEHGLQMAAGEGRFEEEGWRVRNGGSQLWANVVITALRDEKGQLRGFAHVTRDTTERKQTQEALQKSEERYRRLVELSPDALFLQSGRFVVFVNTAAARLLGADKPEQLLGKPVKDVIHPKDWERVQKQIDTLKEGKTAPFSEATFVRLDGEPVEVEVTATPTTFQERPAVQFIAHDITERKRAIAALQKSEISKFAILDTSLDAIISLDHRGIVQEWNPAAERMFGYKRDEAMGKSMDELIIPPSWRTTYREGLADYLVTGVGSLLGRPIELALKRADGTELQVELAITRVLAEEPPLYTVFIRDVTKRKQTEDSLRKSEERFRMLVEGVKDYAIYMLDPQGRVATWNAGTQRIEGYSAEEIVGQHFSRFFTAEETALGRPAQILSVAAAEGRFEDEGWRVRKDGSCYWANVLYTALCDETGKLYGFSKISRDMTEQKKAEDEIRRLNTALERRVFERTAQLEAANKELEAFSYSVSHDLRAPLRHVHGFVEILQKDAAHSMTEENQHLLQTIAESARQMGKLIDDLLAFARMGRAQMCKASVSLAELVRAVRRDLLPETQGRKIEWVIGDLPTVQGDPIMLRQALVNLISNALKYTRSRKQSRIEIGCTETDREIICFVRDNGVGFDMKYAAKLFGVFQRLHRAAEFEGTGIGLANVRRIIQRHGGRTWAEGHLDRGATFYFSLPKPSGGDHG